MRRALLISIDGFAGFYWDDPALRIPTLRRLAERGAVSSRMTAVFPSTTWPTHVSLVTGVRPRTHGIVGNHILDRATGLSQDLTGDPVYDARAILRAPTLYDRAHAAGRSTAAVDWPCTRHADTLVATPRGLHPGWKPPLGAIARSVETGRLRERYRARARSI